MPLKVFLNVLKKKSTVVKKKNKTCVAVFVFLDLQNEEGKG